MAAYAPIPIGPSPLCPMPISWAKAIFAKIGPMAAKNRFWTDWCGVSRGLKIGPRVSPMALLTYIYRGIDVGHFWAKIIFRLFFNSMWSMICCYHVNSII